MEDVLTFRGVLEPAAASLAAGARLSPAQRSHLLKALDEVSRASTGEYRPKDARFHVAIAEVVGSPSLAHAVADVRSKVSDLLDRIPLLEPNLEHSNRQHQDIVDAILRGDVEGVPGSPSWHRFAAPRLPRPYLSGHKTLSMRGACFRVPYPYRVVGLGHVPLLQAGREPHICVFDRSSANVCRVSLQVNCL
ncbi:FadR/GntR family transcriptional regulator [Arthrobacter sp. CAN_A6]|uniref:FadR/GntR family transcriptional regulator n=1 Tax=Arthrobacter sp. CAN_A6 TaxID=2787721 RepID=UPI003FA458DA